MKRITIKVVVGLVMLSLLALPLAGACAPEELEEFTLIITAIGEGTTSPAPGTSTITEGESVTVTAIPDTGYELGYWEGDVSGTDDSVTFKMESDMSVVAVFVEEVAVWEWPDKLLVTAMSPQSPIYSAFVAWTTPWSEDTGVPVRVICESDARIQQLWVKEGEFFTVAPHQNRSMMYAIEGYAERDWGPWLSAIWMAAGGVYWSFCTLGDSGIQTPYDVEPGMTAIMITISEEPQQSIYGLLAWAQVDPADMIWYPEASTARQATLIMDGKADFCVCYYTTPTWYDVEASPHGLTVIPLDYENDPEGAARFLSMYPWTGFGVATGGVPSFEGIPMALTISPYITRFDTDPELVYRIVKWVDENYDRFKEHPWCAAMTMENLIELAEHHYEPIHDGAVRYLDEIGLWTEELEARRQYNIEQLTLWVEAYQTAIGMADELGIEVDPENAEWQAFWDNYKEEQDLPLLVYYQGPGIEQPSYVDFYLTWEEIRPEF